MGNAIDVPGFVAFRASPMWMLAALADVCGVGRQLVPQVAAALQGAGLLSGVRSSRDGLAAERSGRTSAQMAATSHAAARFEGLRRDWAAIQEEVTIHSARPAAVARTHSGRCGQR